MRRDVVGGETEVTWSLHLDKLYMPLILRKLAKVLKQTRSYV